MDFHIGLPFDQNYRVARLIEGKIGRLWGLDDPLIRQMTLHFLTSPHFKNIQENQGAIMDTVSSLSIHTDALGL